MVKNGKHSKNRKKQAKPNVIKQQYNKAKIASIAVHFQSAIEQIDDPRTGYCNYPLCEILFVAIIAVLCGSESDQDIATFGNAQIQWFRQFMPLKNGIPSHDTYRRIFMLLKPEVLQSTYNEIFRELRVRKRGKNNPKHYSIDGKVSRGCYNTKGKSLLHTVSCWDRANGISLGQLATKNDEGKEKPNSMPMVPLFTFLIPTAPEDGANSNLVRFPNVPAARLPLLLNGALGNFRNRLQCMRLRR